MQKLKTTTRNDMCSYFGLEKQQISWVEKKTGFPRSLFIQLVCRTKSKNLT